MDTMWQDLRYGLRMLAKTPGFTTVAVIALALGIGANSAIFSVIDAILIKPLPYKDADGLPTVFYPHAHLQMSIMSLVVRIAGDTAPVARALTQVIRSLDPNQPVAEARLMEEVISASVLRQRFNMVLLAVFAGTALVLAAVGIYGVMSFFVTRRTHEMGIRMALGARRGDVLGLVLRQGMEVALIGVALGLSGAFAMTRALSTLLFSVKATDPITFSGVSLLLALVALAAIYFPARRATKVDPMSALRYE